MAAAIFENSQKKHQARLAERANKMYEMLVKIASDTEKWTVNEVRTLLTSISINPNRRKSLNTETDNA